MTVVPVGLSSLIRILPPIFFKFATVIFWLAADPPGSSTIYNKSVPTGVVFSVNAVTFVSAIVNSYVDGEALADGLILIEAEPEADGDCDDEGEVEGEGLKLGEFEALPEADGD